MSIADATWRGILKLPELGRPLTEMTTAERETYFRKLRRALRDDQVRRGNRAPGTVREMEIWREGDAKREGGRPSGSPRPSGDRSSGPPGPSAAPVPSSPD